MNPDYSLLRAGLALTKASMIISGGQLVNVATGEIYPADVAIYGSRIVAIGNVEEYVGPKTQVVDAKGFYLVPGLIDGHIHFEVTKLSVTMFAKLMLPRGTTSLITSFDQVYGTGGLESVRSFLDESKSARLRMFFGAPCKLPYTIPASTLRYNFGEREHRITNRWDENVGIWETLGRFVIGSPDENVGPDKQVWRALKIARENRLPAYGSASMLRGTKLSGYVCAGIRSDHEAYSPEEFLEKLRNGLYYMIRESSVTHFLEEDLRVVTQNNLDTRRIAFCTDDVTASDVLHRGHLDNVVRTAINRGIDPIKAIQMATVNCAEIYHIDNLVGSISPGRFADILLIENLRNFKVKKVFAGGHLIAEEGKLVTALKPPQRTGRIMKSINTAKLTPRHIQVRTRIKSNRVKVASMQIVPEIPFVRKRRDEVLQVEGGVVRPSTEKDVLYVAVLERHRRTGRKASAFISGFNFKEGAIASSASPDDNNIVAVGVDENEIAFAINRLIDMQGGQIVVKEGIEMASIRLPIGGIIADTEPDEMARLEKRLDAAARDLGSQLESPFMSMIFLSITGIPDLAITDKGLVDCTNYKVMNPVLAPA